MKEKPKRHPDIETSTLPDGHAVLVSKETEWAFTLTPTAALVWEFCDGNNTAENILEKIRTIPEIKDSSNLDEISDLLIELDEAGFLEEE